MRGLGWGAEAVAREVGVPRIVLYRQLGPGAPRKTVPILSMTISEIEDRALEMPFFEAIAYLVAMIDALAPVLHLSIKQHLPQVRPTAARFLELLLRYEGRCIPKSRLIDFAYFDRSDRLGTGDGSFGVSMHSLRRGLKAMNAKVEIKTIPCTGYVLQRTDPDFRFAWEVKP